MFTTTKKSQPASIPAQLQRWDSSSTVASTTLHSTDLKSPSTGSFPSVNEKEQSSNDDLPEEIVPWAAYLFKYGFIFPIFWIFGAMILRAPVELGQRDEIDPETGKPQEWTKKEVELFEKTRACERKWAKRCLWALLTLLVLMITGLAVSLGVGLSRRHSS